MRFTYICVAYYIFRFITLFSERNFSSLDVLLSRKSVVYPLLKKQMETMSAMELAPF